MYRGVRLKILTLLLPAEGSQYNCIGLCSRSSHFSVAHFDTVATAAGLLGLILLPSSADPQTTDARPPATNPAPATPQPRDAPPGLQMHRLEGVSWDAIRCELSWVVSTGTVVGGEFRPAQKQTYRIDMDAALMQVGAERRGFDSREAENVHALMDLITRYAADSTVWWESGQGVKGDSADHSIARRQTAPPDRAHRTDPVREQSVSGANRNSSWNGLYSFTHP